MTREEVKEILKKYKTESEEDYYIKRAEALDMAIKALEQESILDILDKIRAEIKDWQTDIHDNECGAENHDFVFERIYEIIDEYKEESEVDHE